MQIGFFADSTQFQFSKEVKKQLVAARLDGVVAELLEIPRGVTDLAPLPKDGLLSENSSRSVRVDYYTKQHRGQMIDYMLSNFRQTVALSLKALNQAPKEDKAGASVQEKKAQQDKLRAQAELVRKRQEMRVSIEGAIKLITEDEVALDYVESIFCNNKRVVAAAVAKNGLDLRLADSRLQNDNAIVALAMGQNKQAYQYVGPAFQRKKHQILKALQEGKSLTMGTDEPEEDESFVKSQVERDPQLFRSVNPKWSRDKEFIASVLLCNKRVIDYVDPNLREFAERVLQVRRDPLSILQLPKECLSETILVREAVDRDPSLIKRMPAQFRENPDFLLSILESRESLFRRESLFLYLDQKISHSLDFCRRAAKVNRKVVYLFSKVVKEAFRAPQRTRSCKTASRV